MTLPDDDALRGEIKTIAGRVLADAHPMAWLLLVVLALFLAQPFRYNPLVIFPYAFKVLFTPFLIAWLLAAAIPFLAALFQAWRRDEASGIRTRWRASLSKGVLGQPEYWRDFAWTLVTLPSILACHLFVKVSIHAINPRLFDETLQQYDRVLGFGHDPVIALVRLCQPHSLLLTLIDQAYNTGYYSCFIMTVPLLTLVVGRRKDRLAFAVAYGLLWIVGGAMYVAFPSWGPTYVEHQQFAAVLEHMPLVRYVQGRLAIELWGLLSDPYGARLIQYGGVAAFPSLHLAVMTTFVLFTWPRSRIWSALTICLLVAMFIGSMVTGYHYLSDGLAGFILGAACSLAGRRWVSCFMVRSGERKSLQGEPGPMMLPRASGG